MIIIFRRLEQIITFCVLTEQHSSFIINMRILQGFSTQLLGKNTTENLPFSCAVFRLRCIQLPQWGASPSWRTTSFWRRGVWSTRTRPRTQQTPKDGSWRTQPLCYVWTKHRTILEYRIYIAIIFKVNNPLLIRQKRKSYFTLRFSKKITNSNAVL